MTIWFSFVVLFGLVAAIGPPMSGDLPSPLVRWMPILLLAFGVGFVWFGRWLARDEERFLVDFVAEVLEATPNGHE
jgi:hypothetical protein